MPADTTEHHDEGFLRGYKPRSYSAQQQPRTPSPAPRHNSTRPSYNNRTTSTNADHNNSKDEFSSSISWPIILAVIPTLGAFVAGSAEVWSDFIMILLILYYVYKWITVPWSYYESARSRRMIHQYAAHHQQHMDSKRKEYAMKRKASVEEELRRHELIGLAWVIMSPAIAGYTLQYSRYFLSNYEKYMTATLKPLVHVMALLRERTLFLQSEMQVDETEIEVLQKKIEMMEDEMDGLRKAFATKRDLGQVAQGLTPSIQQLSKAMKRFEKKETSLRSWSEERFTEIDQKVQDFDQFICYSIEQDQRKSAQRVLVTLMFLPMNSTIKFNHFTAWYQDENSETFNTHGSYRSTTVRDPSEVSYSGEEAAFGVGAPGMSGVSSS
ncbi:hypothetical protein MUCCIDRAFT_160729 [Mucor lusitanicus CBS 277.49]|uniref:Uncharacterized protein n=1 Tax=Mucor lusitanicus CBS 277.49 TaxID=747725 RepID=A0A162ZQ12_MUCCL|nr:hypothetical protein MUCCIDRAFT_160729 [Mucor lusitanicus CBS 277.49]